MKVAQREIWVHGELQTVTHKAFDLLTLLLQHHNEVVSKSMLQQRLWGSRPVAENLLAKTVVQLRHAIGDDAAQPVWIKTVHRVGYRFVGPVTTTHTTTPAPRPAPTTSGTPQRRIALLPSENRTGERQFVWVELGLTTLIGQALESDPRIALIPMQTVLRALDGMPPEASVAQRAATLRTLVGAQSVVWSSLARDGEGLQLDYQTIEASATSIVHALHGDEAIQLGERLATHLAGRLFPNTEQVLSFGSDDPFISQLLARATQFNIQEQWRFSIQLLHTALILEPANMAANLLLLTNLVMTADKQTFALGEDLLKEARSRGDIRMQGVVHTTLARCISRRDFALARHHLKEALLICEPYESESWVIQLRLVAALRAHYRRELVTAREQFHRLLQQSLASGDQLVRAMTYINLGLLEWDDGQRALGRSLMEQALALLKPNLAHTGLYAHALGELAAMTVQLGAVSAGKQLLKQACELGQSVEEEHVLGSLLGNALDVYPALGGGEELARLTQAWSQLESSEQPFNRAIHAMARGRSAARAGDDPQATILMRQAIEMLTEMEYVSMAHAWLTHWLAMEVRAGAPEAVQHVADRIKALPTFRDDADLQASVRHAEAARLHAEGRREAALQQLHDAAALAPPGRIQANALLDAAWLHLERGELTRADQLLAQAAPWLEEHPCGLALAARRASLDGHLAEASRLQRAGLEASGGRSPAPYWAEVLAAYSAARDQGRQARIEIAPRLIGLI